MKAIWEGLKLGKGKGKQGNFVIDTKSPSPQQVLGTGEEIYSRQTTRQARSHAQELYLRDKI